jgi:hypothetical protein
MIDCWTAMFDRWMAAIDDDPWTAIDDDCWTAADDRWMAIDRNLQKLDGGDW